MKFRKTYRLDEISKLIESQHIGDSDLEVKGINEIHNVEHGDITFVDNSKYYNKAISSKASVIIIDQEISYPKDKALIISKDPFADYNKIVQLFRTFKASEGNISENAVIGTGTVIQANCFVGENVEIGKNCLIHSNVSIYDHPLLATML